ncbi:MAG: hypothetical protein NC084_02200 [Bacteroides sp.]|nr:hypothetical protein [Bacteroides sp.]
MAKILPQFFKTAIVGKRDENYPKNTHVIKAPSAALVGQNIKNFAAVYQNYTCWKKGRKPPPKHPFPKQKNNEEKISPLFLFP